MVAPFVIDGPINGETAPLCLETATVILNETDDAAYLLEAICMMAPQAMHPDQCTALATVARTAKEHLIRAEKMVKAKWKGEQ